MADNKTISIGIGEVYATKDASLVLAAYGLGSCVGVSAYDDVARVGGVAHILLPTGKDTDCQGSGLRFADVAVPTLIRQLADLGAAPRRLVCKVVGGAQILNVPWCGDGKSIGQRNVDAVKETLSLWNLAPSAMETGGFKGRTLRLIMATGQVFVRTVGKGEIEL